MTNRITIDVGPITRIRAVEKTVNDLLASTAITTGLLTRSGTYGSGLTLGVPRATQADYDAASSSKALTPSLVKPLIDAKLSVSAKASGAEAIAGADMSKWVNPYALKQALDAKILEVAASENPDLDAIQDQIDARMETGFGNAVWASIPDMALDLWPVRRLPGRPAISMRRALRPDVYLEDFGADITGNLSDEVVTANTAALLAAHDALPYGGIIGIRGAIGINGGWIDQMTDGVIVVGMAGQYGSTLVACNETGPILPFGNAGRAFGLQIVTKAGVVRSGTGLGITADGVNGVQIENCRVQGQYGLVYANAPVGEKRGGLRIKNCSFQNPTPEDEHAGSFGIYINRQFDARLEDIVMAPANVTDPQPSYGIRIGSGDTIVVSSVNVTATGRAGYVDPDDELLNLIVDKSWFDKNLNGDGLTIKPQAGGRVIAASLAQVYVGNSLYNGLLIDGRDGLVDHIDISACAFVKNGRDPEGEPSGFGGHGVNILAAPLTGTEGVTSVTVTGGIAGGNASSGVFLGNNVDGFRANLLNAGDVAYHGTNEAYGIQGDTSVLNYSIMQCDLRDNGIGGTNLSDVSASKLLKYCQT